MNKSIPSLFGESHDLESQHKVKRTVTDLLYEIYDDAVFFRNVVQNDNGYAYHIKLDIESKTNVQFYSLSPVYLS